ncbi:MAG TPA: serine/threonine-protein kinase [Gemmataceae bacterium]|jgi:serine/threonine protein kinase|nr:serine/threonine-protein kinase [Gemmataceae bacterium]
MNSTLSDRGELFLRVYQVVRLLGEGGMGQVYLGRHVQTGREVVIKVMRDHLAKNPRLRAAFQREMDVMKSFRHPFAVDLMDGALEGGGGPCLILEYVDGLTLETLLERQGRMDPRRVGRLLSQLCQVLHAAHGAGILHRDLSAENLMVVPGAAETADEHVKVMDFGLARLGHGFFVPVEKLTGAGTSIGGGTPDYMCPEQIRGEEVDQRGDLYSVGVILYRMLTGRLPFGAETDTADILLAHVRAEPLRFAQLGVHDVPAAVETVVRNCLAKHPHERPQSAQALAVAFAAALGQAGVRHEDFPAPALVKKQEPRSEGVELDRLEAWMPEQIAVMKLRGFIDAVGGEVVASEPGSLRVRLRDPRVLPEKRGFLSYLGLGRRTLNASATLLMELLMEKKQVGGRGLVEITVMLPRDPQAAEEPSADEQLMRHGFGERICRELRAYLLIGS